jgi:hypothetical protein
MIVDNCSLITLRPYHASRHYLNIETLVSSRHVVHLATKTCWTPKSGAPTATAEVTTSSTTFN